MGKLNKYFSEDELYSLIKMLRSSRDDVELAFNLIDIKNLPGKDRIKLFRYISKRTPKIQGIRKTNSIEFLYNIIKIQNGKPYNLRINLNKY